MSYFLNTNFELLIIARLTSFIFHTSYELVLIRELRVNVYCTDYFLKGFFVTLILTYLEHEKIRRSGEENTKMKKICHGFLLSKYIPRPKIAGTKLFFSLRQGITEALIDNLSKTLITNGNVFK